LFVFQLYTGSVIWQYETYIGPPAVYSTPGVNILDPIVQTYSFPKVDSVFDYIKLVFAHPWEFAGIYFRHFVAALNPVFGESYVSDLLKPKVYLIFANALLMFVTALGFIAGVGKETGGRHALRSGRPRTVAPTTDVTAPTTNTTAPTGYYRRTFAKYLPFYPLLLPCLAILPSSMEARFMLPAYVLMYGLLAYAFDYKQIAALVKKRPVTCAAAFLLLFAFLLSTFQTIWAFTEHGLNIYPLR
ncbi:MAG: hypothetical protein LBI54_03400, partial [Lachnospiraceae bacterium]|nr:hypothetical protein [Lachnospiraceae bacterium]